jgi:prepilin-type N-terminal cleavage/methylation domain-containing protein
MSRAGPRSGEATGGAGATGARRRAVRARRGFTLIETALATIIVGVGVLAMVSAQAAFHQKNAWSTHASIATALANELREMTWNLPQHDPVTGDSYWGPDAGESLTIADFDDLDDFDGYGNGLEFSADAGNGPVNARREIIPNMAGWSQIIRVFNVDPFNIAYDPDNYATLPADGTTDMMAVEVIVRYRAPGETAPQEMTRVSWIAPR